MLTVDGYPIYGFGFGDFGLSGMINFFFHPSKFKIRFYKIKAPTKRPLNNGNRGNRGRSYKEICRVVNPNQFAFPNKVQTGPFCPY